MRSASFRAGTRTETEGREREAEAGVALERRGVRRYSRIAMK